MSPVPFMASCFSAGVASPWVRRSPQNFFTFYLGVQVGCCPLWVVEGPSKTSLFILCFVSASHFVSVLLSFIDPSSSLVFPSSSLPGYPIPPFLRLRYSLYPFFVIPSCLASVVFSSSFSAIYPTSFLPFISPLFSISLVSRFLFRLRYSRYRPSSPVFSPCRYQSCSLSFPYPHPTFRLLFLRSLGYPFLRTRFCLSHVIHLRLLSPFLHLLFPLYFLVILGIGLPIQSPRPVDTSPILHRFFLNFVLSSSSGIPAFHLLSFVSLSSALVLWFNPRQLSLSSSVSACVSILANRSSRLNPSSTFSPSSFLCTTRPLPPSIHPSTSFVASTSCLDCSGFPSPFLWGSCGVPHCRFDSWPFCISPPPIVFATFRAPSPFPVNRLPFVFVFVYVSTASPLSFQFLTRSL
jgi:hypothetical protein